MPLCTARWMYLLVCFHNLVVLVLSSNVSLLGSTFFFFPFVFVCPVCLPQRIRQKLAELMNLFLACCIVMRLRRGK